MPRGDTKEETPKHVTNLTETKKVIRASVTGILRAKGKRKELNTEIAEHRARVKNCGVPPAALDLAIKMKEADTEDRASHDEGYAIARDALGMGLQSSMFEMLEERTGSQRKVDEGRKRAQPEAAPPHPEDDSDLAGETGGDDAATRPFGGPLATQSIPEGAAH